MVQQIEKRRCDRRLGTDRMNKQVSSMGWGIEVLWTPGTHFLYRHTLGPLSRRPRSLLGWAKTLVGTQGFYWFSLATITNSRSQHPENPSDLHPKPVPKVFVLVSMLFSLQMQT